MSGRHIFVVESRYLIGRKGAGTRLLVSALERRPDYADARINLASPDESRTTTHPLRHHAARADYQPA